MLALSPQNTPEGATTLANLWCKSPGSVAERGGGRGKGTLVCGSLSTAGLLLRLVCVRLTLSSGMCQTPGPVGLYSLSCLGEMANYPIVEAETEGPSGSGRLTQGRKLSHPAPRATAGGAALLLILSLSPLGLAQQAVCLRTVPPGPDHPLCFPPSDDSRV